jgi:transcriptional regulator with XRE-family HTH domain
VRHIGERVREARKEANMTQELLARRAGLSLNMLSRLELGKIQDPHISSLRQIAHAVGVPVEVLVTEEELSAPLAM